MWHQIQHPQKVLKLGIPSPSFPVAQTSERWAAELLDLLSLCPNEKNPSLVFYEGWDSPSSQKLESWLQFRWFLSFILSLILRGTSVVPASLVPQFGVSFHTSPEDLPSLSLGLNCCTQTLDVSGL